MTCKDCLLCEVCYAVHIAGEIQEHAEVCQKFKNKADFVEVVRCRDCDVPHNKFTGCPKLNGLIPPPNYYCAGGERKKNDKE